MINVAKNRNERTGSILFDPSVGKFCRTQDFDGKEAVQGI